MFVEKVLPIARERLVTIAGDLPLIEAARLLHMPQTDLLVVCDADHQQAGVVTKTDILRQIGTCQGAGCTVKVSAVMTRNVIYCQPRDRLDGIWSRMKVRGLRNIPITDDSVTPLGILTAYDALQALLSAAEQEEQLLHDYVMCVGYR